MKYKTPRRPAEAPAPSWRLRAACRHADPDLFFPIGTTGPAIGQIGEAKRGGTTEDDRQTLRRALQSR